MQLWGYLVITMCALLIVAALLLCIAELLTIFTYNTASQHLTSMATAAVINMTIRQNIKILKMSLLCQ